MFEVVLFDLDGTLVDSLPDLTASVNRMTQALGLPARSEADMRVWVGNGMTSLVKRALTGDMRGEPPEPLLQRGLALFQEAYDRGYNVHSRLYPGVPETLARLAGRGIALGCVTNKPGRFTRPLLAALGIARFFGAVVAGEDLPVRKPDPAPLHWAVRQLGRSGARVAVVGDSRNDVQAARNAGFPVVCLSYGYNHGEDIRLAGADAVIDRFPELELCLAELAGRK